jgi:hypothetical protein
MRLLKEIKLFVLFHMMSVPVIWGGLNGRWFVFRDKPLWFVIRFAALDDDDDPHLQSLIEAARVERDLRLSRLTVKAEYLLNRLVLEDIKEVK